MRMHAIPGIAGDLPPQAQPLAAVAGAFNGRMAAVYDAGIVAQARSRKHSVAFFAIDGNLAAREGVAIQAIAESAFGVDKGSARVSVENATLSLAFDPQRVAFAAILRFLDRKLAANHLTMLPIQVLDRPLGES